MSEPQNLKTYEMDDELGASGGCPVAHTRMDHPTQGGSANADWWPNRLNLSILRKHNPVANPMDDDFDYAAAFSAVDLDELRQDVVAVMTTSQDWWPADFGHYGGLFIRMAWHSAGTYRINDGRGGAGSGMQRFAPLNSWPDNVSLDKARRLLWPVKKKYGRSVSWADLMVFAGTVALEHMGLPVHGFAGGRVDVYEPDEDIYWGPEATWLGDERYHGERQLERPLAAVQMGLIYVNPEGPNGNPDPVAAAHDIRETFARMAMNDYETVALIAGGHTLGKTHGAAPDSHLGPDPEAAGLEEQGFGWRNGFGSGKGRDAITSGLEVTWSQTPTTWSMKYFDNLFGFEWEVFDSPAGAKQWRPKDNGGANTVPDPETGELTRQPTMLTTDLSMRFDPAYEKVSRHFHANPEEFAQAYAKAWYKLTHRDMGPIERYLGAWLPAEQEIWQDPVPALDHELVDDADVASLKEKVLASDLTVAELVGAAWASAVTFRSGDKRGGTNGARVRLEPQIGWEVNDPAQLSTVLRVLEGIQGDFNGAQSGKRVSMADLIVLAGCAAVEKAARDGGVEVTVPFTPGRTDASQEMTDVESFAPLEPTADGFRNFMGKGHRLPAEFLLVDRANLLGLSAPEMTVLVGGMRALGANAKGSDVGVFTDRPGVLSNDFFATLMGTFLGWRATENDPDLFQATTADGRTLTASRVDLVFGSNSELRAVAEVYAADDAKEKFVRDFVAAWDRMMMNGRYDV